MAFGQLPAGERHLVLLDYVDARHAADRLLVELDVPGRIVVQVEPGFEGCLSRL